MLSLFLSPSPVTHSTRVLWPSGMDIGKNERKFATKCEVASATCLFHGAVMVLNVAVCALQKKNRFFHVHTQFALADSLSLWSTILLLFLYLDLEGIFKQFYSFFFLLWQSTCFLHGLLSFVRFMEQVFEVYR